MNIPTNGAVVPRAASFPVSAMWCGLRLIVQGAWARGYAAVGSRPSARWGVSRIQSARGLASYGARAHHLCGSAAPGAMGRVLRPIGQGPCLLRIRVHLRALAR